MKELFFPFIALILISILSIGINISLVISMKRTKVEMGENLIELKEEYHEIEIEKISLQEEQVKINNLKIFRFQVDHYWWEGDNFVLSDKSGNIYILEKAYPISLNFMDENFGTNNSPLSVN